LNNLNPKRRLLKTCFFFLPLWQKKKFESMWSLPYASRDWLITTNFLRSSISCSVVSRLRVFSWKFASEDIFFCHWLARISNKTSLGYIELDMYFWLVDPRLVSFWIFLSLDNMYTDLLYKGLFWMICCREELYK